MPLVGFGTWRMRGREAHDAVLWALEFGYRHLDTAAMYRNEAEVGDAIRRSGVGRGDIFITTKVAPDSVGRGDTGADETKTLQRSLDALGTDYLDLWLVHSPPARGGAETWGAFINARDQGQARTIGVSNYSREQVDELTRETGVTPAVNQIKWSPFLFDRATLEGTRERGIVLEGYSPFLSGRLDHPVLADIAARYGKSAAQVVIRWHVEHRVVVIPKSAHRDRIAANLDVFDFSLQQDEVAAIDRLAGR